jgi:tyrosyl-tRNA synthetase
MSKSPAEQFNDLVRGTVAVHTADGLKKKLAAGKPLRVKLGVDPTSPDIHLGHTVVLRKLRQFQDLGHQAVLIIGDFTALVGDPTGRNAVRPQLTPPEVEANAKTYFEQVGRVLDMKKLEIVRNSAWLKGLTFFELLKLGARFTVAQFLEREDFNKRYKEGKPIGLHELMYPVMQAYDSVMVKADVELGGNDQTFNLLAGRDLMRDESMDPQVALTMPLLTGLDGEAKMSKSYGNHVGVAWGAKEMFFALMRVPDRLMKDYYTLLTAVPADEVDRLCDAGKTHPKSAKLRLSTDIVKGYHGEAAADEASKAWDAEVSKGQVASDIPELAVEKAMTALKLVALTKVVASNGDARRLIEQGGVELDGTRLSDPKAEVALKAGMVLKVGKKSAFRILVKT